jgi:hypothetical protein
VVFTGGAQPLRNGDWLVPVGIHDSYLTLFRIPSTEFNLAPRETLDHQERKKSYHDVLRERAAKLEIRKFTPKADPPANPRAIVYPWKHDEAVWQELRFSLRSVEKYFQDKECPIYILGTNRPNFLLHQPQGRVKFLDCWSYWEALALGVQLARKVLWMNDDIFFLRETDWEDCEDARYYTTVKPEIVEYAGPQSNVWKAGVIRVLKTLIEKGVDPLRVYSTHTPYVFDRENAKAVLREFGVWDKMPFELAYFHLYGTNPRVMAEERVFAPPFDRQARFLNVLDRHLSPELRRVLEEMFPHYASWELARPFPGSISPLGRPGRVPVG